MAQSQDGRDTVQEWVHKPKEKKPRKEKERKTKEYRKSVLHVDVTILEMLHELDLPLLVVFRVSREAWWFA